MEIINHHAGKGNTLNYFRNPKRSTEIKANYEKVFNYLRELNSFNSELMFLYEYFVP